MLARGGTSRARARAAAALAHKGTPHPLNKPGFPGPARTLPQYHLMGEGTWQEGGVLGWVTWGRRGWWLIHHDGACRNWGQIR